MLRNSINFLIRIYFVFQQLSETLLKNPDFIEKIAENINRTRSAKELEASTSSHAQCAGVTDEDLQNIVCTTQKDPCFEELLNEIVNEHFFHPHQQGQQDSEAQTSTSSEKVLEDEKPHADVPIKQRLRPRCERKAPVTERKNSKKINILSDVPYTGIVPAIANLSPALSTSSILPTQSTEFSQILQFVTNGMQLIPVLQAAPGTSSSITSSALTEPHVTTSTSTVFQGVVQIEAPSILPLDVLTEDKKPTEKPEAEKKGTTPKITLYPNHLESRSKTTPRHVRTLNFNHASPSMRHFKSVKEFSTPTTGIPAFTPGSAPANMSAFSSAAKPVEVEIKETEKVATIDENSISNTPKVVKTCRRRKIAETKPEEKSKSVEDDKKLITKEDWIAYRTKLKDLDIDERLRLLNAQEASKISKRRRPTQKRLTKKALATVGKSKSKSPNKQNKNEKTFKKEKNKKAKSSSPPDFDENKPLGKMKFKIASPRKVAALKNMPKQKKKTIVQRSIEKFELQEVKEAKNKETVETSNNEIELETYVELNSSDPAQDAANTLLNFSETPIQLSSNSNNKSAEKSTDEDAGGKEEVAVETAGCENIDGETKEQVDSGIEQNAVLETPLKEQTETPLKSTTITPLPNTPRFAVPLISQETPMPKIFASTSANTLSLIKNCDILTPSFPITPGFKETPLKDAADGSPTSASGYISRRTDYSSCSSYYKPDESEDINQNFNAIVNQRHSERASQSESDGGSFQIDIKEKILGSVKKVDCPGAIERVKSFTEEKKDLPTPHCTMMNQGISDDDPVLSESFATTATEESSSSSFTCSTCSTDSPEEENMIEKLDRAMSTDERDSEWDDPEAAKEASPSVMNEKTGEVRFPLRNWITPKKVEIDQNQMKIDETNKIKALLHTNDPRRGMSMQDREECRREMEAKRIRTLEILKGKPKAEPKYKKTNVKCFKLPAEETTKPAVISRKDQILQQQLTSRPRPTPLLLMPLPSRRKNATPRKTMVINEIPRLTLPNKKKKIKIGTPTSTPAKTESLSIESVSDNAVMPEASVSSLGLEMSSSFNTSNEEETEETASTVIANKTPSKTVLVEEGSNTFQQAMIEQGFDKIEAKELQAKLVDDIEVDVLPEVEVFIEVEKCLPVDEVLVELPVDVEIVNESKTNEKVENNSQNKSSDSGSESESNDEESSDEEFEECLADENERKVFCFKESDDFQPSQTLKESLKIIPLNIRIEDRTATIKDSGSIELFTMNPEPSLTKKSPKKTTVDEKKNGKESPSKNGKAKQVKKHIRWEQSKKESTESQQK